MALILRAGKTKTGTLRIVPVGQRLAAVLEMLRTDPAGEPLAAETFVFGTEVGDRISSVKTAWGTTCEKAGIADLHFHDLRREFACRLLESRAELHDVRDFLGHTNITTTSRYLRSTTLRLERALELLERRQMRGAPAETAISDGDSRNFATPLPHGASAADQFDDPLDSESVDVMGDSLVSRIFASWNQLDGLMRQVDRLRRAA